jgi:hypothetical protein
VTTVKLLLLCAAVLWPGLALASEGGHVDPVGQVALAVRLLLLGGSERQRLRALDQEYAHCPAQVAVPDEDPLTATPGVSVHVHAATR